jgi:hypothetical protein
MRGDRLAVTALENRRELGWYAYLVHNDTVIGSLATLVHLPFMLSFLAVVLIGAFATSSIDPLVLFLSLLVVALLLYAEHMLDDMSRVGKPWSTVFSDKALAEIAALLFAAAGIVGLLASFVYASVIPFVGVLIGTMFCILYGLEIWHFHAMVFGALGFGAIPAFSYVAQSMMGGLAISLTVVALLLVVGFVLGFVMLALYESTKTHWHSLAWRILAVHFAVIYSLAGVMVLWHP